MDVALRMGERRIPKEADINKDYFLEDSSLFLLPMNLYLRDRDLMRESLSIED